MVLSKEKKQEVVEKYSRAASDTGSPEAQIALITERISYLVGHLKTHKKDHAGRRGLLMLVGQRKRLLNYLEEKSIKRYETLVGKLGLR